METLLILAAVVSCVLAALVVGAMSARNRRPPLRMDNELDIADEHLLLGSVAPSPSPIDRSAEVLELDPVAPPPRRIGGPDPVEEPKR